MALSQRRRGSVPSMKISRRNNRQLVALDPGRHLFHTYQSQIEEIPRKQEFQTAELIGRAQELALDHVIRLFHRFNWDDAPRDVLRQDQEKLISGRF